MSKLMRSLFVSTSGLLTLAAACGPEPSAQGGDQPDLDPTVPYLADLQQAGVVEQVTLVASRDTTLVADSPNRNEGSQALLSGSRTLIAFDSTQLAAAIGSQDVLVSADLHLSFPSSGQPSLTLLAMYRLTSAWTELGATYNCAIDSNTSNQNRDCAGANAWSMDLKAPNPWVNQPTAAAILLSHERGTLDLQVTKDVERFVSGDAPNDGWVLLSALLGSGSAVFQSRESAAPPTLTLSIRRCNATLCDDGNSCTADSCDSQARCVHKTLTDGSACSDGDVCTVGEQCSAGVCTPGDVVACGPEAEIAVNEVESSGGTPGDWIELYNAGTHPVDVGGWVLKDNDDTHHFTLAPATVLAPASFLVVEEASLGFGLGSADAARLFDLQGALVDGYTWTAHATGTYARCPDGTGAFMDTTTSSKGAANVCTPPPPPSCTPGQPGCTVVVNEVESSGGVPGDWIELFNPGAAPVDVSGWIVKDDDDTHNYAIPAGTIVAPAGYFVVEEAALGFGLGSADAARVFTPSAVLVDAYSWTSHAATTYGRCPNGSGPFTTTNSSTKGAANDCTTSGPSFTAWPGGSSVTEVDATATFASNLSGLSYEPASGAGPALLWGIQNDPSVLYRLTFDGTLWGPDASNDWQSGKILHYPGGGGSPDAEGLTRAEWTSPAIYVVAERDNANNGVSRMSILRFDTSAAGASLTATHEWNLTADLPPSGANTGLEGIAWVPDTYLVANGFRDQSTLSVYDPASYPDHGTGVFFVGLESVGTLYAYVLNHASGTFQRIASAAAGQPLTTDLSFDRDVGQLWTYCDDACGNRGTVLRVDSDSASPTFGELTLRGAFERPAGMPNVANEGIAMASEAECNGGQKAFFWADDSDSGGHSLRQGTVQCGPLP